MPDVHVDSMIFQYSYFFCSFLLLFFYKLFYLYFCSHFTFDSLFKVNCIFDSLICLFFFVSLSWFGISTNQLRCFLLKKKNPSLFFSGIEYALFWLWQVLVLFGLFWLFLCTEWVLFSGVKLLISRCVLFSSGFRFSCLVLGCKPWLETHSRNKLKNLSLWFIGISSLYC